jgi:Holliday junction resolvase-like predicted endonuclease
MSKAKQIGTSAETGVRKHLLREGYSELEARRNVLTGSLDQGDVWLHDEQHGLIVFEVKGGASAKTASHEQTIKWLEEARVECLNASGTYGFLVTQRAGFSSDRSGNWWAYTTLSVLVRLSNPLSNYSGNSDPIVRLTLKELTDLIRG